MKKKKVVFIGNRPKVLEELLKNNDIEVIKAFVIEQPLIGNIENLDIERLNSVGDKDRLINFLKDSKYDICVSAGCSYILPRGKLPSSSVFINCHPSVLPYGKGIHPLNECFLSGNNTAGATIHLLVDKLDAGDILNQSSFELTDEIDVSVLYGFIFDLEAELLSKTIIEIIKNNMVVEAIPQKGEGTYYSREKEKREFSAKDITVDEFNRNTKAFSSSNLGVYLLTDAQRILAFSSEKIKNNFIIKRYENIDKGKIIFQNNDVILVKLEDGIVKINKFQIDS